MGKKEKRMEKKMKDLILQLYLKEPTILQKKLFNGDALFLCEQPGSVEHSQKLEDVVTEQRNINYVTDSVMKKIEPYILAQMQESKHEKKSCKKTKKEIKVLKQKIETLEFEQKQLCQAIAFLASAMNVAPPNSSSSELKKGFKNLYKRVIKSYKNSLKNTKEISLLQTENY